MSEMQAKQKRIAYLDVARSIAIVSITFNHAVNRSFATELGQYAEFISIPFALSVAKALLYAFSRLGVPIFLMITGALMLRRDYSGERLTRFLKHNWLQLLIVTDIWLTIMFWYLRLLPGSPLDGEDFVTCLVRYALTLLGLNSVSMASMWYMGMILCVYLLIPILAHALKSIDHRYFLIPMGIVAFGSLLLPDINAALESAGVLDKGSLLVETLDAGYIFTRYVVYLLLGYFIAEGALERIGTRALAVLSVMAFVVFCAFQLWAYSCPSDVMVADGYESILPLLVTVPLFELLRRRSFNDQGRPMRVAHELSIISFGIYFVHICIMEGLFALINLYGWPIDYLWRFLFLEVVSFVGAALIVDVLRKNKVLAKYLFGIK